MNPDWQPSYDKDRSFAEKSCRSVCYAPYTNLFFDQRGKVRACCWNDRFPVGDITRQSIDEIWGSLALKRLRQSVKLYSFENGCGHCENQIANGWTQITNMHSFDRYPVTEDDPEWPKRIELSISNSCNLECIMCDGEYSSAIRKNRENRPVRPKIYPASFSESLRRYIPHLSVFKFLGGEPFLVPEYYEIWDLMIEDNSTTVCHLTTNGTQFNARIAEIMELLRFAFAVSLDGVTKKTVESIRVNANFDKQMDNLRIFKEYTSNVGTRLDLTYCFMRQNWHEFGDFCLFAEDFGCNVAVNTVHYPPDFGVYNLPKENLKVILNAMERQNIGLDRRLSRNRKVWNNELDRVRKQYDRL